MKNQVPGYEAMLDAYHRAFHHELREIIRTLPIGSGSLVLDVACGDGAYTTMLASQTGRDGHVLAIDTNQDYLRISAQEASRRGQSLAIEMVRGSINGLPFPDDQFDVCWCAHSLYSLPDPVHALKEMSRVTKPGGIVAVLESDTLHHVMLSWPIEVELAVKSAELLVLVEESEKPRKFYVGRDLRSVFRQAGMARPTIKTFAHDRSYPLAESERLFLMEYLRRLSKRVLRHLGPGVLEEFEALTDPKSPRFLLDNPTCPRPVSINSRGDGSDGEWITSNDHDELFQVDVPTSSSSDTRVSGSIGLTR